MKTLKALLITSSLVFLVLASSVAFAQIVPGNIPGPITQVGGGPVTIQGWVGVLLTVIRWIYTLVFILAVLFILLAAFNFVTSKGDPEKVKTAKNQIIYAAVGIAVALLSYAIVTLIQNSVQNQLTG